MKIYRVIAEHCEGKYCSPVCLKFFSSKELALKFKEDWENLWQKHLDNNECESPCWYDYKKELEIEETHVETEYMVWDKNIDIMDYEKEYKEAIKRARQFSEHPLLEDSSNIIEYIFPELKESEDKIREKLLSAFKSIMADADEDELWYGLPYNDIIAWLEKQGEQKPADKVEHKFKVGDEIKTINEESQIITKVDEKGYWSEDLFICDFDEECIWDLVEQKPADKVGPKFNDGDWIITNKKHIWYVDETPETTSYLYRLINQYGKVEVSDFKVVDKKARIWTITDAKDGDVLSDGTTIFIFKDLLSDGSVMSYCDYDTDSDAFCPLSMNLMCLKITPAAKEQCDILFTKMKDAGYEWDADKKELSEIKYDETKIKSIIAFLKSPSLCAMDGNKGIIDENIKYLNSLKERLLPQPKKDWSEEDRDLMYNTLSNLTELKDLYGKNYGKVGKCIDWLKSLKERLKGE